MLKSISCDKLIVKNLSFGKGLNTVVGADDAHNSIGKSSILMLIDFAFGGNDFPLKCDDVIRNVGHLDITIGFEFEKQYFFRRNTENPDVLYDFNKKKQISISEFTEFLRQKYFGVDKKVSFRECISGFFRIYQRDNYNDKQPLTNYEKESWNNIRKRTLKIFGKYWIIEDLEKEEQNQQKIVDNIKGTFGSGAVKQVTKKEIEKMLKRLRKLHQK